MAGEPQTAVEKASKREFPPSNVAYVADLGVFAIELCVLVRGVVAADLWFSCRSAGVASRRPMTSLLLILCSAPSGSDSLITHSWPKWSLFKCS